MNFELEERTVDLFVRGNPKNHSYAERKIKADLERQLEEPREEPEVEYPLKVTDYHRFKADVFRKEQIIAEIHFRDDLDTELPDQNYVKGAIVAVDSQKIRIESFDAGTGAFEIPYTHIYDISACKSVGKDMEAWRRDFIPSPVPKDALPSMEEATKLPRGCGSPAEVHSGEDAVLEPKQEPEEELEVDQCDEGVPIPPDDDRPFPQFAAGKGPNPNPLMNVTSEMMGGLPPLATQNMPPVPSFEAERTRSERDENMNEVTRIRTAIEIWAGGNDHSPQELFRMLGLEYEESDPEPNPAPEREQSEREGPKSEDVVDKIKDVLLGVEPTKNFETMIERITDLVFEGRLRL